MVKNRHLIQLVFAAMLAALCCVSTLIIHIPTPTGGFVNLGDTLVILAGWLLSPVYGILAAGLGSMLADIISGYAHYAPATFIIKGLMALVVGLIMRLLKKVADKKPALFPVFIAVSAVCAESIMIAGYFVFEATVLHYGTGALASVVHNLIQAAAGIIGGALLTTLIRRTNIKEELLSRPENH